MKLKKPRKNEVHLWKANLDQPSARVDNLLRILSREERERADRFHLERDRNRFVVGRGLLRKILGRYLVIDAAAVRFEYNATEKPFLASGSSDLRFNLSHSQGLVVYALALGRDVGVDVERVRSDIDWEGISGRYFSASENKALRSFPE
ncbi:MAG TPA: 4'-phosphopantetheinyl transferase, partial [bacterium]|nr:4'-phosphopantetheinyl transferase [bacterium]